MSDARTSRLPLVALGCAIVAVVVALLAAIHVFTRNAIEPALPALEERHVAASDLVKLADGVDVVADAGRSRGVRPKDLALARSLGFADDDALVSLSGRMTLRERDIAQLLVHESVLAPQSLFAELQGAERPSRIVRWIIDGNLRDARPAAPVAVTPRAPRIVNPLDAIETIDATHYRISRIALYQLLVAPKVAIAGARIAADPHEGFIVSVVQPGSLFDRLGVRSGDTIAALNHERVSRIDDVAAWFNNARRGSEITADLVRSDGTPVTIHVAIR